MSDENEVPPYEDLLASLSDQVSHLAYGGDPDDTGQRQIPAAEVIEWAVNELKRLRDRKPTLTAEEREALLTVRDIYASGDDSCVRIAAAIDGLLERHKENK